jgi:hypothetical protein
MSKMTGVFGVMVVALSVASAGWTPAPERLTSDPRPDMISGGVTFHAAFVPTPVGIRAGGVCATRCGLGAAVARGRLTYSDAAGSGAAPAADAPASRSTDSPAIAGPDRSVGDLDNPPGAGPAPMRYAVRFDRTAPWPGTTTSDGNPTAVDYGERIPSGKAKEWTCKLIPRRPEPSDLPPMTPRRACR